VGLPDSKEIMTLAFFVLTQYRLVAGRRIDGRTDTLLSQRPAREKVQGRFVWRNFPKIRTYSSL